DAVPGYVPLVVQETQEMLAGWPEKIRSGKFDATHEMRDVFLRIVPRSILRGQVVPDHIIELFRQYNLVFAKYEQARQQLPQWAWNKQPGGASYTRLRATFYEQVGQYLDSLKDETSDMGILTVLLEHYKAGYFTLDELVAEFTGLFVAAFDTTSNVVAWTL